MKWMFALIVIALVSHQGLTKAEDNSTLDIPYIERKGVDPARLSLDIHPAKTAVPGHDPHPVMILIHGGGWRMGDKQNAGFLQPKTSWLNQLGFDVVSINYRLSPAVQHPAHIDDVAAAIAWVQKNGTDHGLDPTRLFLLGHSAGAHLAALAGADQARLRDAGADPTAIKGVILLDGAGYDIPQQMESAQPWLKEMYRAAFSDEVEKQKDASPIHNIHGIPPPFLILPVADREESCQQSELLAENLRKAGGKAFVTPMKGKNHLTINRDFGKPGDEAAKETAIFLKEIGSGTP